MDNEGFQIIAFVLGVILLIGTFLELDRFQTSRLALKMAGLGYVQEQCIGTDSKIWIKGE